MKNLVVMTLLTLGVAPTYAHAQGAPIIVSGHCDSKSGVTIDDGETSQFGCDTAVIARTDRGTVLIQFTDKSGDDGRILGFAATIEGRQGFGADPVQMLGVERLYLAGGADPVPTTAGSCIMNWSGLHRTGGKLTSVTCGARGEAEGADIKALVQLVVRSRQ
jgi:hypothetical protein